MWHAARIAYFEDKKAPLLLGPVRDVVSYLRQDLGLDRVMVQPHWKFGPHVDVVVDCDAPVFDAQVFPACREVAGGWLGRHPSTVVLDPAAYEALSQKIAITELEAGPYLPLLENNSVSVAAYAPSRALKLPELAAAKERFLCRSLDLTLRLLAEKQAGGDDCFLALAYMMAMAGETYEAGGLSRGFLSYRSHAEYFFAAYDTAGAVRARFDALDGKLGRTIDDGVRHVLGGDLGSVPLGGPYRDALGEWQRVVAETAGECRRIVAAHYDALVEDQTFSRMIEDVSRQVPEAVRAPALQRAPSAVWVAAQQEEGQRVLRSPEFLAFRTTVNFFYMLLPILEVSPAQKFCLCHLVANSAERVFATTWRELMGVAAPHAGGAGAR